MPTYKVQIESSDAAVISTITSLAGVLDDEMDYPDLLAIAVRFLANKTINNLNKKHMVDYSVTDEWVKTSYTLEKLKLHIAKIILSTSADSDDEKEKELKLSPYQIKQVANQVSNIIVTKANQPDEIIPTPKVE